MRHRRGWTILVYEIVITTTIGIGGGFMWEYFGHHASRGFLILGIVLVAAGGLGMPAPFGEGD